MLLFVLGGVGFLVSPLGFNMPWKSFVGASMSVDAIPDLSENQQIVRTEWPSQSPDRIEEQINYPLSAQLLAIPGVRSLRGQAMLGVSFLYVIFDEKVDFYEARHRVVEQLTALPESLLPKGVRPQLGPAATSLGQVYIYTLVGRDSLGNPTGKWNLEELRRVQDFHIKQALLQVKGVAEVASIGGYTSGFEVLADPLRMRSHGVSLMELKEALRASDIETSLGVFEMNQVEYTIQATARLQRIEEIESVLIHSQKGEVVRVSDVSRVVMSNRSRRALLDYEGVESVGGIVTTEYGANTASVLAEIKKKIQEIAPSLPQKRLDDGRISRLHIHPVYDRSQLIEETIGTLSQALVLQVLITVCVMLWMLRRLSAAISLASLLPFSILGAFLCMYVGGVEIHIVSLMGIAIAIGTVVDMGILLWDNIQRHQARLPKGFKGDPKEAILSATLELAPSLATAMGSTLLGFLPVFALEASEGKLMHPLAWTKSFTLLIAFLLSLYALPAILSAVLNFQKASPKPSPKSSYLRHWYLLCGVIGLWVCFGSIFWGTLLISVGTAEGLRVMASKAKNNNWLASRGWICYLLWAIYALSTLWSPLGLEKSLGSNLLVVAGILTLCLGGLTGLVLFYKHFFFSAWRWRWGFVGASVLLISGSILAWRGSEQLFGASKLSEHLANYFPGLSKSFMPRLEEGSFLLMPIGAPHASLEEHKRNLQKLDRALASIPEVEEVLGKLGRAETALDPAPMHMFEIIINYKSEFIQDEAGRAKRFAVDEQGNFLLDSRSQLIPDKRGKVYRNWRPSIRSTEDIWAEIEKKQLPMLSAASPLQPIETRRLMLQTGLRTPLAVEVRGSDLSEMSAFSAQLAKALEEVEGIDQSSIYVEPIIGKAYVRLSLRKKEAQYLGISARRLSEYLQTAVGDTPILYLQEGRERRPLWIRYGRSLRSDPEALAELAIRRPEGGFVSLGRLIDISYATAPQMIRSKNSWPVSYLLFDIEVGHSATEVVEKAHRHLQNLEKKGQLQRPSGISYGFEGTYKETLRMERKLLWVMPLTGALIFALLYLRFRKWWISLLVMSSACLSFAGGFWFLWLYQHWVASPWVEIGKGIGLGGEVSLSTAVWVGFIALLGIATDDGVVMAGRLEDAFSLRQPRSKQERLQAVYEAARSRVWPCLMTTATTLIALLPLLTSTGKGAALMRSMACPIWGGMLLSPLFLFVLPIVYAMVAPSKRS